VVRCFVPESSAMGQLSLPQPPQWVRATAANDLIYPCRRRAFEAPVSSGSWMTKLLRACVRERLVSTPQFWPLDAPGWFGASDLLGARSSIRRQACARSLQIADRQGGHKAAERPAICIDGYCSVVWQTIHRGCIDPWQGQSYSALARRPCWHYTGSACDCQHDSRMNRICKATPQALDGISVRRRSASTYWLGPAR
jgi:hypothetical protein